MTVKWSDSKSLHLLTPSAQVFRAPILQDFICKKLFFIFLTYEIVIVTCIPVSFRFIKQFTALKASVSVTWFLLPLCLNFFPLLPPPPQPQNLFFQAKSQIENKVLEILMDKHINYFWTFSRKSRTYSGLWHKLF